VAPAPAPAPPVVHHLQDPELNHPAPKKLLSIDWATTQLDADALWQEIAPTGEDWEQKLAEIPGNQPIAHQLAIALLKAGNFACSPLPATRCGNVPLDLPEPAPAATLADPCLRRLLALWAISELSEDDLPAAHDALRSIAALPPPESQLVVAAIGSVPEANIDDRYDLLAIAWRAGQHEVVNGMLSPLDQAHLVTAASQLHVDGALQALSAQTDRAVFVRAISDEQLAPQARVDAMIEVARLEDRLAPDLRRALVAATKSSSCEIAAAAARILDEHGDHAYMPRFVRTSSTAAVMRNLCVLASVELAEHSNEALAAAASYFPTFIASRGLDLVRVSYDAYSDSDPDGDGDVHTEHHSELVPAGEAVLPDVEELVRAMKHCTQTVCRSDDHEFRFTLKPGAGGLVLSRLEIIELPPCAAKPAIP
jgi:hypothetical protein